jgi:hypothetical protein
MSDEAGIPTTLPTRQAVAVEGRSRKNTVSGKLKVALDLMIREGLPRAAAATKAGLADSSVRSALRKAHVLSHYNAEMASLRTSLRARNIHRLDGIADGSKNDMARVSALKALEAIADQSDINTRPGMQQLPGLQIVIIRPGSAAPHIIGPAQEPAPPQIDVTPQVIAP